MYAMIIIIGSLLMVHRFVTVPRVCDGGEVDSKAEFGYSNLHVAF